MPTRRHLVLAAAALGAAGPAFSQPADDTMRPFTSGGRSIGVEWFPAAGSSAASPKPAVLLLHGAEGLSRGAAGYRVGAGLIAASGIGVAFVHYLDRTGDARVSYANLRASFPAWVECARDALTALAEQPGTDRERLGIVGISLGAALALQLASDDGRVKAIVDFFGPVPEGLAERRPRLPPTLVLHGERDGIVPVRHARDLARLLADLKVPHDVHVYPDQGHGFTGAAQLDAAGRVSAFLARHLGS